MTVNRLIYNIWRCSSLARNLISDANDDDAKYTLFSKMKKKTCCMCGVLVFLSQRQIIFYAFPWFTLNGGNNTICVFGEFNCSVFVISNVHWESWAGACVGRLPEKSSNGTTIWAQLLHLHNKNGFLASAYSDECWFQVESTTNNHILIQVVMMQVFDTDKTLFLVKYEHLF